MGVPMVAKFDFEVTRGVAKSLPLSFIACRLPCSKDNCGRGPMSLKGYSFALEIIKGGLSTEVVDELSTDDGRIKTNAERGTVTLFFTREATAKYPRYSVPYRITATYEKGTKFEQTYALLFGEIKIRG